MRIMAKNSKTKGAKKRVEVQIFREEKTLTEEEAKKVKGGVDIPNPNPAAGSYGWQRDWLTFKPK